MSKFQDENQVKGRYGELIAAFAFPPHWVMRPIPDDFGLDLELEIFHPVDARADGTKRYQTRGEHAYFQVKTTDSLKIGMLDRDGVAPLGVVKFSLSTNDLKLVESMGTSVPVVLLVVDRAKGEIYYVCLNDYVGQYLNDETPDWRNKVKIVINIPVRNILRVGGEDAGMDDHWNYFLRLAQRSKLYSAFNLIHFYWVELQNAWPFAMYSSDGWSQPMEIERRVFIRKARLFLERMSKYVRNLNHLDVWSSTESKWVPLHETGRKLAELDTWCRSGLQQIDKMFDASSKETDEEIVSRFIRDATKKADAFVEFEKLGRLYEDVFRLEGLPVIDPHRGDV